jgi:hypothetical protein
MFSDRTIVLSYFLAGILLAFYASLTLFFFRNLPPLVPIFNQLAWGTSRIGGKIEILIPFGIAISILLINIFSTARFYIKVPLLARILSLTTLLISFLALLFLLRTLFLIL